MAGRRVAARFLLGERLGHGGMGVVWRATDELLGREVAVKQLHTHRTGRDRLIREARAAARLNHPGAVIVHDVVSDDDEVFVVMEFVAAPTLADVVDGEGPLPPARVARIGLGLLEVLEEAHRIGIVHRDVKPANVMVLPGDRVKLADFGIARIAGDPTLTREGTVLGSPAYMAPEQARGDRGDAATDRWALGATLYYAAEGVAAFGRETYEACIAAVLTDQPPPPRRAGTDLAELLSALLDKDAARRPEPDHVRRVLERVAAGTPAAPEPPPVEDTAVDRPAGPRTEDPGPRRSRRRTLVAVSAAVVALILLAVPGWLALRSRTGHAGTVGRTAPRSPHGGPLIRRFGVCSSATETSHVNAIATTTMNGHPAALVACADDTVRSADLSTGAPGPSLDAGSDLTVQALAVGTVGGRRVLVAGLNPGGVHGPYYRMWDLAAGSRTGRSLSGNTNGVTAVQVGELHGRQVVVSGSFDSTIYAWDPTTGKPVGPRIVTDAEVISLALTTLGDRRVVVEGGYGSTVRVWDLTTGTQVGRTFTGHKFAGTDEYVNSVALGTVGGRQVAVSTGDDDTIQVSDLATGRRVGKPIHTPADTATVTTVRGRQVIVSGGTDGAVRMWDLATHEPVGGPLTDTGSPVSVLTATTLDGRPVAIAGYQAGTVAVWSLG